MMNKGYTHHYTLSATVEGREHVAMISTPTKSLRKAIVEFCCHVGAKESSVILLQYYYSGADEEGGKR